ncbi:MAG: 1-deoxy-D-xylulose-5-phosphate reductoisomerase, partial [Firmicutes bacterium]|nr:1-deoxy-D-xylulose-5-phosphate reductoisomerase [Bacillota bacterium]
QGNEGNPLNKILLTGSGGPFRGYTWEELKSVTKEQALHHPKWVMGQKITIDSATLMNKGLEVIEARWLFDVTADQIEVLIHPQSIIHSAVEFKDHSIIAQMGNPDMRIPISYALSYPKRVANDFDSLDFFALDGGLTFEKPDMETFKPLKYAFEALKAGGSAPVVLNAANEELVQSFLEDRIGFTDIIEGIERIMENHNVLYNQDLDAIIQTDLRVRRQVKEWVDRECKSS